MPKKRMRISDPALDPAPAPAPDPDPAPAPAPALALAPAPALAPDPDPDPAPVPEPSKRRWYEKFGPLEQLTYDMACAAHFVLRHHNAEEHIRAYASNVYENGTTGNKEKFFSWLAWLHEVD